MSVSTDISKSVPSKSVPKHTMLSMEKASNVYMHPPGRIKVILFQPNKTKAVVLPQAIISRGYVCEVSSSPESILTQLQDPLNQIVVVINIENNLHHSVQELLRQFQSIGLHNSVVMAILPHSRHKPSETLISNLQEAGISRIFTSDEGERRFFQELKLAEMNELRLKRILQFSQALKEAVDHSHDAIQVTNKDSSIIYVNKSFTELNGFTSEECLGRPASDILRCSDESKWSQDNGSKNVFAKKDYWEGECSIERRSGSASKQYIKLIPMKTASGEISHRVTIQRLLFAQDINSTGSPRQGNQKCNGTTPDSSTTHTLKTSTSRGSIGSQSKVIPLPETPLTRGVRTIMDARDNSVCPPEIRESLDKCLEIFRNVELYLPNVPYTGHPIGIVEGLLNRGRRYSLDSSKAVNYTSSHHHHSTTSTLPPDVQQCLETLHTWTFNIIQLEKVSHLQPLYYVGMSIFNEFHMCDALDVDDSVIGLWLKLMESNYHRKNTYHNSTHAADVLQGTAYLVRAFQSSKSEAHENKLEPLEIAALLITAVIHDVDHPGRTNAFLTNSGNSLAVLYNDRAVLENHHAAFSFKVTLQSKQHNIYQGIDNKTYHNLRSSIVDLVLATDMSKHFEHLAKFKGSQLVAQGDETPNSSSTNLTVQCNQEARMLMKRILVKCADISNASRPLELCKLWASKIAKEYFDQTNEEKEKNLPVVFPDFDQHTCNLPRTQVKFIDFFVSGLFNAWNSYCPIPVMMDHINFNYEYWKQQYDSSPNISEDETEN